MKVGAANRDESLIQEIGKSVPPSQRPQMTILWIHLSKSMQNLISFLQIEEERGGLVNNIRDNYNWLDSKLIHLKKRFSHNIV